MRAEEKRTEKRTEENRTEETSVYLVVDEGLCRWDFEAEGEHKQEGDRFDGDGAETASSTARLTSSRHSDVRHICKEQHRNGSSFVNNNK